MQQEGSDLNQIRRILRRNLSASPAVRHLGVGAIAGTPLLPRSGKGTLREGGYLNGSLFPIEQVFMWLLDVRRGEGSCTRRREESEL